MAKASEPNACVAAHARVSRIGATGEGDNDHLPMRQQRVDQHILLAGLHSYGFGWRILHDRRHDSIVNGADLAGKNRYSTLSRSSVISGRT